MCHFSCWNKPTSRSPFSHRFRSPLLKPPKRRGGRSPRCLPLFTGKNHGCSVFLEGDMLICCHKTTYDNICTHQRKNTQAYSYYTILHIYIKLWAQAVCLNKPFNTRTALASCFALSMQHWLWDAFFTHRCCTWVQGCNTHYYLSLLYVWDLTQRNLFNIFLYIYICSRFSWNISHTSHLLKDNAYVVVDANACRQKQVYLLNSNAYSQLFSDHPSLYIYIYTYIIFMFI